MSRPASNLRLFVSIEPPAEAASRLVSVLESLGLAGLRAGRADQAHLTAQFIGDTPSRDLERVIESVRAACAGTPAFVLTVGGLTALPERGPARLIAATTDAPPALLELHRRLARRLARSPRRDEADRFRPHITLGRFLPARSLTEAERRGVSAADTGGPRFEVRSVRVMRSTLLPAGAEHHEVARIRLGA